MIPELTASHPMTDGSIQIEPHAGASPQRRPADDTGTPPIELRWEQDLPDDALGALFLSVGWESGRFPERLRNAMRGSHSVCTAWCGDRLIGLMNALSDGDMTVYHHYLLVDPAFQKQGIGARLVEAMKARYAACLRQVLIAYDTALPFYLRMGFTKGENKSSVAIERF